MKFFKHMKDGGPESKADGYWLIEWKSLFSIAILHFHDGTRDAYHNHAFSAISWLFKGTLRERLLDGHVIKYTPSFIPIYTSRKRFHQVRSEGDSWVLTFRGPWLDEWQEYIPEENKYLTLTHGREIVDEDVFGIGLE